MPQVNINNLILAAVVRDTGLAAGVPLFLARNAEEQQKIAAYLARILNGMVHDLENGVLIVVRH
jgi:predicted FMN-binding regulatory protein PaiB